MSKSVGKKIELKLKQDISLNKTGLQPVSRPVELAVQTVTLLAMHLKMSNAIANVFGKKFERMLNVLAKCFVL